MNEEEETNIQTEMRYVTLCDSCRQTMEDETGFERLDDDGMIRLCRRLRGHTGQHASDYPFLAWPNNGTKDPNA